MSAVELLADCLQLPLLELAHREAAPAIGRPDHGGVHELQDGPLAEGVGHDLRPAPFLAEQALEEIRIRYERGAVSRSGWQEGVARGK
jgi:hypothetical protein